MAEYIGIKGSTIQTIAGDPPAPIEGQVWYNSTSTVLKGEALGASGGTWASAPAMNTAKGAATAGGTAGAGTQTSAINAGGGAVGGAETTATETYDGTSWTTSPGTFNSGRDGCGTAGASNTSALFFGGSIPGQTEKTQQFNGTSWTEVGDLGTPRYGPAGLHGQVTTASQLAMAGGFSGSPNYSDACEEWTEPSYVAKTVTTS